MTDTTCLWYKLMDLGQKEVKAMSHVLSFIVILLGIICQVESSDAAQGKNAKPQKVYEPEISQVAKFKWETEHNPSIQATR